jgi:hypothetical protein
LTVASWPSAAASMIAVAPVWKGQAGKKAGKKAGRQAGRQVGRRGGGGVVEEVESVSLVASGSANANGGKYTA